MRPRTSRARGLLTGKGPPVLAVVGAACMTGAAPVLTKVMLRHLSVESVLTWRYLLAALVVTPLLAVPIGPPGARVRAARSPTLRASLAVVALFGSGVSALLFTGSLLYAPAAVSNALSKSGPLLVAFLAYVWLREPVSLGGLSLVAAMLISAALLGTGEAGRGVAGGVAAGAGMLGVAMATGAGLLRAGAEVAAKAALTAWSPTAVALARFGGGVVVAGGLALARHLPLELPQAPVDWLALVTLATLCTGLPIVLYYSGVARMPVHHAAGLRTIGTAVTAVASWLVLGERLGTLQLLGLGSLLFAAYAMANMPAETRRRAALLPRLSGKLVAFVVVVVAASTVVAGGLQAWQLHSLMSAEVEASLSRGGALIGHMVSLQPQASPPLVRRYFDSLVQEQISGPGYRADFSYLVLADASHVPIAWAFRSGDWPEGTGADTARLIAAGQLPGLDRAGRIPVHVLVHTGDTALDLWVGYRATVAAGPLVALSLRTALLAALLALIAGAAAATLVRGALAPLASASAQLRREAEAEDQARRRGDRWGNAGGRPARGPAGRARSPDEAADVPAGAESAAELLARMGERRVAGPLREACIVGALLPPRELAADPRSLDEWRGAAMDEADALDGFVLGIVDGWLVVAWGLAEPEVDDALRAYAWCRATEATAALLASGEDWPNIATPLERAGASRRPAGGEPLATAAFVAAAEGRLKASAATGDLWVIEDEGEI